MRAGRGAMLFAAGDNHACSLKFAQHVCAHAETRIAAAATTDADQAVLRALVDAGHLALVPERRSRRAK
jgi:hypothetical protein